MGGPADFAPNASPIGGRPLGAESDNSVLIHIGPDQGEP
mgnify:CR=1 FL=1